jgi:hypothetical protein
MRTRDDPKQAWVGLSVAGVVNDQLHLAADTRESRLHLKFHDVVGMMPGSRGRQSLLDGLCLEEVVKPLPRDLDLDAFGFEVDPADERYEDGSDRVWCKGGELF